MGVAHDSQSSREGLSHCCCPDVLGPQVQGLQAVSCNPLHALASLSAFWSFIVPLFTVTVTVTVAPSARLGH